MGGNQNKQPQVDPRDQIEDAIINMRMTSKQFENAAKRAQKDQKKEIERARQALKKNNEEGAKLFLQNAANRYRESENMLRMAHRMDVVAAQMRSNVNNSDVMKTIANVTPMLAQQAKTMDPSSLSSNLESYQKAMDELMIAGKIMDSQMNENSYDQASESGVETMLTALKQEVAMEINQNLQNDPNMIFNKIQGQDSNSLHVMGDKK